MDPVLRQKMLLLVVISRFLPSGRYCCCCWYLSRVVKDELLVRVVVMWREEVDLDVYQMMMMMMIVEFYRVGCLWIAYDPPRCNRFRSLAAWTDAKISLFGSADRLPISNRSIASLRPPSIYLYIYIQVEHLSVCIDWNINSDHSSIRIQLHPPRIRRDCIVSTNSPRVNKARKPFPRIALEYRYLCSSWSRCWYSWRSDNWCISIHSVQTFHPHPFFRS